MGLAGKVALVIGAGQTPGETIGNGRATAMQFAREGARVIAADIDLSSAEETAEMIHGEGYEALALHTDVQSEDSLADLIGDVQARYTRLDILHNNVGISIAGGDARVEDISVDAFDRVTHINLLGMILACKHVLPIMRAQSGGVILNISSMAAIKPYPLVAYKTTKAGVVAMTEQLAQQNARYGIRVNAILPGLMNTPMAIESRVSDKTPRSEVVAARDNQVPLGRKMGSAWDVAHAATFLVSDKAGYITGIALPVDGGLSVS